MANKIKTKLKYILKSYVDREGFDANGIGDYTYVAEEYQSFDSILHQLLARKYQLAENTLAPTTSLTEADFIQMLQA